MDNEIDKLKKEVSILTENNHEIWKHEKHVLNILLEQQKTVQELQNQIVKQELIIRNMKYELNDPRNKSTDYFFPKIESHNKLIDKIIEDGCSLARFGDGEFSIMENIERQAFQHLDMKLAERLKTVILSNNEKLLIAIADNYGNLDKYTEDAANGIRFYMSYEVRLMHEKYLKRERIYYDAYVTRPYVIYRDKINAKARFDNLKRIWNKRNVIIIEGAQTRIGIGNDLMDNALSVKRILGPATSSFDRYDEILNSALENAYKNVLFLIALGPSAGVMAYDLTMKGYQAIDIGHIDLEYEWFLAGQENRGVVKNKYNNEVDGGEIVDDKGLPKEYYEQIIADFS